MERKLIFPVGFFCAFLAITGACADSQPKVKTKNGEIFGTIQMSRGLRPYESYRGIPYAKPPVRFQAPEPAQPWSVPLDATKFDNPCPQFAVLNGGTFLNETCLFVNVFVPKVLGGKGRDNSKLPVMVWLHGGFFIFGSGNYYGASYFMDQNVILVTVNYRLGVLGFLSTGDRRIDGNMGLKDQLLALKWVQENIDAFGGDPGSVTLFGESAGAACAHYLMLSPAAKGLFNRVILQSGSSLAPWALAPAPGVVANAVANLVGCGSSVDIKTCLLGKTTLEILNAQATISQASLSSSFAPALDTNAPDSVIPAKPLKLITDPAFRKRNNAHLPLVVNYLAFEGLLYTALVFGNPFISNLLNSNWAANAPKVFLYGAFANPATDVNAISEHLLQFYFNGAPSPVSPANAANLTNIFTDLYFYSPSKQAALLHAKYKRNVAFSVFKFRGNFSIVNIPNSPALKDPAHGDELQYQFKSLSAPIQSWPDYDDESIEKIFSVNFVSTWASIASEKNGNKIVTGFNNQVWSAIKRNPKTNTPLDVFEFLDVNNSQMSTETLDVLLRWTASEPVRNLVSGAF